MTRPDRERGQGNDRSRGRARQMPKSPRASPIPSARPSRALRPLPARCRSIWSPRAFLLVQTREGVEMSARAGLDVAGGGRESDRRQEIFLARGDAILPRPDRAMAAARQRLHGDRGGRGAGRRGCRRCRARQGQQSGVLHGVPLAHKDMYYDAGKVVTCGSKIRRDFVATTTSTALQRLKDAGTVRLGSLQMVEFAYGPTGHNPHYGAVRNPWNVDHITGGSSSGSGSAVAARLTFAALGSDTGGSIRMPAHFCGVTGFKTTVGLHQPRRRDAAVAVARYGRPAGANGRGLRAAGRADGGRRSRGSDRIDAAGAGLHGGDHRLAQGPQDRRAHRLLCRRSRFRGGAGARRDASPP